MCIVNHNNIIVSMYDIGILWQLKYYVRWICFPFNLLYYIYLFQERQALLSPFSSFAFGNEVKTARTSSEFKRIAGGIHEVNLLFFFQFDCVVLEE